MRCAGIPAYGVQRAKKKVLHVAWTSGGALFIRKSEEASCSPQKISTESALHDA